MFQNLTFLNTSMIKKALKRILFYFSVFGIDLFKTIITAVFFPKYLFQLLLFVKKNKDFKIGIYPIIVDKFLPAGTTKSQYFHQDLYVATKIYQNNPKHHFDIGSRIDGFVAHVASFRKLTIIDIRTLEINKKNIDFLQMDLMNPKLSEFENKMESLSCLHTIEHLGLGRYGDKLDINGHLKGLNNIFKLLKTNAFFYFSVPLGLNKVYFNAHRTFSIDYLLKYLKGKFILEEFSYVNDQGIFFEKVNLNKDIHKLNSLKFGLGIFILRKIDK